VEINFSLQHISPGAMVNEKSLDQPMLS
jgi:hypothetical protein